MPIDFKSGPGLVFQRVSNRPRLTGPGLLAIVTLMTCGAAFASNNDGGLTRSEMQRFAEAVPSVGRIYAVKLFRDASVGGATSAAVLSARAGRGWSISVIAKAKGGGFRVEWASSKLEDSFAVSSPAAITLFDLGSEQAVTFGGCAAHMCPEIFSELLYLPSKRQSFVGTCDEGKVTYSFKVDGNTSEYKSALDDLLKKHPATFAKPDWDTVCSGQEK